MQLRLDPLGQEDAQELLTALLGDDAALQPLKRFILEKTEGNPFFIEEIAQALREQGVLTDPRRVGTAHLNVGAHGVRPLPANIQIPTTVQAVLASRIDRLPPAEKELLQTLAVIGKEFPLSLLRQVVNQPEDSLQQLLSHLQTAEFIYEQPAFPEVEYTFKHALTQEVAYNSLLIEQRRVLHERTAQAIEALFHSRLEDYYSELAHHYSRSGNTQKAVEYLQRAGQQAVQRSANAEAVSHLTTASVAIALLFAACLHQLRRERRLAQERTEAMIALSREHGFPEMLAWGICMWGWTLAEQGQEEEGIAQMRQGLTAWQAVGAKLARTYYLALLTEAHGKLGQTEEGLTVLAEALAVVHKNGERWYEAELYRLKGELSLKSRQVEDKSQTSQDKSGVRSPRQKNVFSRLLRLLAGNRRSRWSCGPS